MSVRKPHFQNKETAVAKLERIVWTDDPVCPHCGAQQSQLLGGAVLIV